MPEKETVQRAQEDKEQGKAPSTQAGEFVREEMEHIREGKHGARSTRQAIAIGLSKARRAGVELKPPRQGAASEKTRRSAARDVARGREAGPRKKASATRSRATSQALKREGHAAALSSQARSAAARRTSASRSAAARQAAKTKGPAKRSAAAKKAARTRAKSSGR
jgi:hypothetical protein